MMTLAFLSFFLGAFTFDQLLREQMKRFSFILAIAAITVFLYQATFLMNLHHARWLVIGFSFTVLLHDFGKTKGRALLAFIMREKKFLMISLGWFFISLKARLHNWDEFSWASFVKHLNQYGGYWDSSSAILPQGMRYFPGLSIWESFFVSPQPFMEGALYFSIGLIFITGLHFFLSGELDKRKAVGLTLFYVLIVCWFSSGVSSIYVDGSMGIILGFIMLAVYEVQDSKDFWVPMLLSIFLAITKETGLCLSLLGLLALGLKIIKVKNFKKKTFLCLLATLLIIAFDYFLWRRHVTTHIGTGGLDFGLILDRIRADLNGLSIRSSETLSLLVRALFYKPVAYGLLSKTSLAPFIAFFGSFVFLTIGLSLLFISLKNLSEHLMTFLLGLGGYLFLLTITFLYFFTEVEGRSLASYERYMGVYFLGFSLLAFKILIDRYLIFKRGTILSFVFLFFLMPPSPRRVLPSSLLDRSTAKVRTELSDVKNLVITKTPERSRIWFIQLGSYGMEAMILRYEVAPRIINNGEWSIGEKYFDGDVWTENLSLETFREHLETFDYMVFGNVDAKFIERYGSIFQRVPETKHLYKKSIINNQLTLVEVL